MPPINPIELVRRLTTGQLVRCGNPDGLDVGALTATYYGEYTPAWGEVGSIAVTGTGALSGLALDGLSALV